MNKNNKKKFSLLDLLIILLSVVLAVSILLTIRSIRESGNAYYDTESSLYYDITDKDYASLADRYYNSGIGNENDPRVKKVSEFYAVGRYFEKAFFANAYEKAGSAEKAEKYRSEMIVLEEEMGQFIAEKQNILEILQ